MFDLQKIANDVIKEVAEETLRQSESKKPSEVTSNGDITYIDGGFIISYDGDFSGYYEFGTGTRETVDVGKSFEEERQGKPNEWVDEAGKFLKTGTGSIGSQPYLYPSILNAIDELPKQTELKVKEFWNKLKL
jgi:hypothetical protein